MCLLEQAASASRPEIDLRHAVTSTCLLPSPPPFPIPPYHQLPFLQLIRQISMHKNAYRLGCWYAYAHICSSFFPAAMSGSCIGKRIDTQS